MKFVQESNESKDWNPYAETCRVLVRDGNYVEFYVSLATPFPLTKRDLVYSAVRLFYVDG